MLEKFKLWLMTDEKKEQYLLAKEKEQRNNQRKQMEQSSEVVEESETVPNTKNKGKVKDKDKDKNKTKEKEKSGFKFGRKKSSAIEDDTIDEFESQDEITHPISQKSPKEDVKPKVKIKVISEDAEEPTLTLEEQLAQMEAKREEEDNTSVTDLASEILNNDVVESTNDDTELEIIDNEYTRTIREEMEERRKLEAIQKKQAERDEYMSIMIDLPPTTNVEELVEYALKKGVPTWYLIEYGILNENPIIEDVSTASQKVHTESVTTPIDEEIEEVQEIIQSIEESQNNPKEVEDYIFINQENEINESEITSASRVPKDDTSTIQEDKYSLASISTDVDEVHRNKLENFEIETDITTTDEEDTTEPIEMVDNITLNEVREEETPQPIEMVDSISISEHMEDVTPQPIEMVDKIEVDEVQKETEKSMDTTQAELVESLKNRLHGLNEAKRQIANKDDVVSEDSLNIPTVNTEELQKSIKEAVKVVSKEESPTSSLAEKLKEFKTNRQVLNKKGNQVVVKEELMKEDGTKETSYKNYQLLDTDADNVEVGHSLEDTVTLEVVEDTPTIDGMEYNISKEEERELLNKYGKREVWILSTSSQLLEKAKLRLSGSRYIPKLISSNSDFLLATRNVDNVIVFTKDIPKEVKKSIAGYLSYIQSENRNARLITIEESLVNSKLMEHIIKEFSIEELDNYFNQFDYSRYAEITIPLVELYKVISFDLTDSIEDTIMVDNTSLPTENGDLSLYDEISLDDTILTTIKSKNPLDNQHGDISLELSDIILIQNEDDTFK